MGSQTTRYRYSYDDRGNITGIYIGDVLKYSYVYDNLGQLLRENNAVAGKTYVYTYDNGGNITSKKVYAYTTGTLGTVQNSYDYTYGNSAWGDQLTAYRGNTITYDSLGNPLSYYNGSQYTFTWEKGRQLVSVTKDATTRTYAYDESGRRISKVDPWDTTYYIWSGDRLVAEYRQYYDETVYLYDASGSPIGFQYKDQQGYYTNGEFLTFWYEKNLQGDIVGICDENGNKFVSYSYDAWGNLVNMAISGDNLWFLHYNMAEANPFRYRGYYYDRETGLYYLGSRYYDPATGRFLNADGYVNANGDLTGFNMYAYCSNNPVMYTDPTGEGLFSAVWSLLSVAAPVLTIVGDVLLVAITVVAVVVAINEIADAATVIRDKTDETEAEDEIADSTTGGDEPEIYIYRHRGTNPGNLVPTKNDVAKESGLSFSTKYQPNSFVTTIEKINSTGVLVAIHDGANHITVYPIGGTVEEWRTQGTASIWTQALLKVCGKT